jgi:hypothetical protein
VRALHAAGDGQGGLKISTSSAKAVERIEAQFRYHYHGTMRFDSTRIIPLAVACLLLPSALRAWPAQSRQLSSSSSAQHVRKPSSAADSTLDPGSVGNGVYRNKTLAVACKIPPGWVLRTDEMNTRPPSDDPQPNDGSSQDKRDNAPAKKPDASSGSVLLAAFSRPPEATGEDVNSSGAERRGTVFWSSDRGSDRAGIQSCQRTLSVPLWDKNVSAGRLR